MLLASGRAGWLAPSLQSNVQIQWLAFLLKFEYSQMHVEVIGDSKMSIDVTVYLSESVSLCYGSIIFAGLDVLRTNNTGPNQRRYRK